MRRASSRRGSNTRRPQVVHSSPISAPSRTTFHSLPPQGCGLRRRTTSFISRSGSTPGLYHPSCYNHTMLGLSIPTLVSRIIILLLSFSVHEFSHAAAADALGDDTPRLAGRLTLNPLAHLDLWGSLLLLIAGFGWAKPVPINPANLQHRTGAGVMLTSLAGPTSNFLMAVLAAVPLRLGLVPVNTVNGPILPSLYNFLFEFIFINLILMLFNLIPLAPLDGDKVLDYLLPERLQRWYERIRPFSPIILIALVFLLPRLGFDIIGMVIYPVISNLMILLGVI